LPQLYLHSLEPDGTLTLAKAAPRDGYLISKDRNGAEEHTSLTASHVYPLSKPVPIRFEDLYTMDAPPIDLGDVDQAVLKFAHDFGVISDFSEDLKAKAFREQQESLALTRIHRTNALKDAPTEADRSVNETLRLGVIAAGAIGVLALIIVGLIVLTKGVPAV
jgi:hypothetical protein